MSDPIYRSDFTVKVVPGLTCGDDSEVAAAAWVEDPEKPTSRKGSGEHVGRVIRDMMLNRHPGPFENGRMTVYLEAPGVVWWQLTRYRFMSVGAEDFGFNLESGRWRVVSGVFYRPPPDRPIREPDGFKPHRPQLHTDEALNNGFAGVSAVTFGACWDAYEQLVGEGVAREVARMLLPQLAQYVAGYVGGGPLTWLHFFSKRRKGGDVPTFPQWEIERVTEAAELLFAARWPIVYGEFIANGRIAPI